MKHELKKLGVVLALALVVALWRFGPPNVGVLAHMTQNFHVGALLGANDTDVSRQSIIAPPSITAVRIDQLLRTAHSPAAGTGAALYAAGVRSGIDPLVALAFFWHESQFGTLGVARVTHALGNIRCSAGYRCVDGYRWYSSWQAGYADWFALITQTYIGTWHLTTLSQIVPVYAPARAGNDVAGYLAALTAAITAWRQS